MSEGPSKKIGKKIKGLAFFPSFLFAASLFGYEFAPVVESGVTLYGVTPDGTRAVGKKNGSAIYWSPTEGAVALPGGTGAYAIGAGANGVVFGNKGTNILYWTLSGGNYSLNTISIGTNAVVNPGRSISHNGLYILGVMTAPMSPTETRSIKFKLEGDEYTSTMNNYDITLFMDTYAITDDGFRSPGHNGSEFLAYYNWASPSIHIAAASGPGALYATDAFGKVMVGQRNAVATQWRLVENELTTLTFAGATAGIANAVTADGTVIVGQSNGTPDGGTAGTHAFRWTADTGMQTIEQWLISTGSFIYLKGLSAENALGVSDDGNTIVGLLSNGDYFFVAAGQPFIESSTYTKIRDSLNVISGLNSFAVTEIADFMMHGTHGHPGRALVEPRKKCSWVAGDMSVRSTDDEEKKQTNVIEVGLCERVNQVLQLNFAFGRNADEHDLPYGSTHSTEGLYVVPEVNVRLPQLPFPLWLTMNAWFNHATLDIQRGYPVLDDDLFTPSNGRTKANVLGYRVRLDAVDSIQFVPTFISSSTTFTPYVDFSHSDSKVEAYTETGENFPLEWDSISDHSTILRLGVDSRTQVGICGLLGTLEFAHRMEDYSADSNIRLFNPDDMTSTSFVLPGIKLTKNWVHLGAGIEGKIGEGIASFTVNATTRNEAPTYWGAASYRITF